MKETRTPSSVCVNCGNVNDCATSIADPWDAPLPGDISVCLRCGHLTAFSDDLSLRPLTDSEMYAVAADKTILKLQKVRASIMEGKS